MRNCRWFASPWSFPGVPLGAWETLLPALARSILRYVPSSLRQAFYPHTAWLIVKPRAALGSIAICLQRWFSSITRSLAAAALMALGLVFLSPIPAHAAPGVAAGGNHSLALKSDGTVVAWGDNGYGQSTVPAGLSGVISVSGGFIHSLARKSDGTVVAWGDNSYGQSTVPAGLSSVVAISAGYGHSLVLKSDGTVVAWGDNSSGETTIPAGLSGVTAIAAGLYHSVALKNDGTVVAWGNNVYGQSTVPAGLSGVTAVSGGGTHSLALKSDGTVVAWGYNGYGQSTVPAGLNLLPDTTPPSAPGGVTATAISSAQINVSW